MYRIALASVQNLNERNACRSANCNYAYIRFQKMFVKFIGSGDRARGKEIELLEQVNNALNID